MHFNTISLSGISDLPNYLSQVQDAWLCLSLAERAMRLLNLFADSNLVDLMKKKIPWALQLHPFVHANSVIASIN